MLPQPRPIKINRRLFIRLLPHLTAILIALGASAQTATNFKDHPLTRLVLKDGSFKCGYYDSSNNILYDCNGNITLNKPADVVDKLPEPTCCPEASDSDGDGVEDAKDGCPGVPGGRSNYGCPSFYLTDEPMVNWLATKISFAPGTYKLLPESLVALKKIAKILKGFPLYRVKVEVHTESIGDNRASIKLSKARAAAVAAYLLSTGIDEQRVTFEGLGSTRPIDSNKTAEGRARNRRVEIKLIRN